MILWDEVKRKNEDHERARYYQGYLIEHDYKFTEVKCWNCEAVFMIDMGIGSAESYLDENHRPCDIYTCPYCGALNYRRR